MSASDPASRMAAVTPHDTNPIDPVPRALYVGTGGDMVVRASDSDSDVTLVNVPDGALLPAGIKYVRSTGTTADDIVAWY